MKIQSWLGCYSTDAHIATANSKLEVTRLVNEGYSPIGSLHSYSPHHLHTRVFRLGEEFNYTRI